MTNESKRAERIDKALVQLANRKVHPYYRHIVGNLDIGAFATNEVALVLVRGHTTQNIQGPQPKASTILDLVTPDATGETFCWFDTRHMRDVLRVFDAAGEFPQIECRIDRLYLYSKNVNAVIMGRR